MLGAEGAGGAGRGEEAKVTSRGGIMGCVRHDALGGDVPRSEPQGESIETRQPPRIQETFEEVDMSRLQTIVYQKLVCKEEYIRVSESRKLRSSKNK